MQYKQLSLLMAKRSKTEDDRVDTLEQKVRELKTINRSLTKKLNRINKGYRKLREPKEPFEEEEPKILDVPCPDCEQPIKSIELMGRSWDSCRVCGWRSEVKIKQ